MSECLSLGVQLNEPIKHVLSRLYNDFQQCCITDGSRLITSEKLLENLCGQFTLKEGRKAL